MNGISLFRLVERSTDDYKLLCQTQLDTLVKTVDLLQGKCKSYAQDLGNGRRDSFQEEETQARRQPSIVINKDNVRLSGNPRSSKGFLTIGIPTVKREKENYLHTTLDSIIENTSKEEKKTIVIVVFLADEDNDLKRQIADTLKEKYSQYFWTGFIELIEAPPKFYPSLLNLKQKYGDSVPRIAWRSKQVVDYAFLFTYCQDISNYYLQLEDDVISSPNFINSITNFINTQADDSWVTLEFSELGFIGKLYHSHDLVRLAEFALLFYDEQPIDYLLRYHLAVVGQTKTLIHLPSLFQHIGKDSSLQEKQQGLRDRFFNTGLRKYNTDNPPAKVYSSMRAFSMYLPQLAYTSEPGYFWGVAPKIGDYIYIIFETPVRLKKVIFETGSEDHKDDFLRNGRLDASPKVDRQNEDNKLPVCSDYVYLGSFENGRVEAIDIDKKTEFKIACLRVSVTQDQIAWMILKEIAVWTAK
ncbi:alpha-1,3-mannosyl-glycoprotein 4-beta-N-acetylglucosaminyltransferase C-like [Glandiceps talaboti]